MAATVVDRVRRLADATGLLADGALVLLSGGRDSVCLLDVAVALAGPDRVRALHVDHGLRPDSAADAEHCADLCGTLGVGLTVHRLTPPGTGAGNVQAWAREERYAAAGREAAVRALAAVTAHTASDQVETVLYRLAASPGRRALLGMPARGTVVARPLLAVTREQTGEYCAARGLAVRDDPGNDDPRFARSRVRHGLVPALRAVHPAAEQNVLRTVELLRDEAAVLDAAVAGLLDGQDAVAVSRLTAAPPALARLVVRHLAEAATGGLCARAPGRLDELLALRDGALDLGDGARAEVRDGVLRIGRTPPLPPR
ncbi:tRNA lysidine(34) synthetase TilS [Paraconexibacter algicola]|uniref:tRNA(Ile)-lysidine synthase n=1 Tax=Paraconexibacter algicola TaxID=2133960 RepID=A0A2T4UFH1_9ACTN|nr:tRNA lysidine(34) synthetase TilS [Paraconexibacter algicola]PTL56527.1 tRNA lysidine(34) synthetase TilS [Paraconexibacter algicola]